MSSAFRARIADDLARRAAREQLRRLEIRSGAQRPETVIDGRAYVNFSSNDYLGLATHPRVLNRVRHELPRAGFGAGAAALLSGHTSLHDELVQALCAYTGFADGLLFSSGYLANTGALPALIRRQDLVVHDRLNHASLIDGVIASGATHRRYRHGDVPGHELFGDAEDVTKFLITESVFSMDGDEAPLAQLLDLARNEDAVLYVDDAHGFGVTDGGRGAAARLTTSGRPAPGVVLMITFGKALGSVGAIVLADADVVDYLRQHARTSTYDTALPPVCAAAALEALSLLRSDNSLNVRLAGNIGLFRDTAANHAIGLPACETPIQPIMIGDENRALAVAGELLDRGYYVRAIRTPTVPRGTARLRITLTAAHTGEQITALVAALAAALDRHPEPAAVRA